MTVSLIVAVADNGAIGKNNDLLWKMPADMRFFVEKTTGHPVIMGRKNYLSIPEKYRPLKNRTNIIVTRDPDFSAEGSMVCNSVEEAIDQALTENKEVFIIGGGEIYRYALQHNLCQRIYLTEIHESFDADVYFPPLDHQKWKEIERKDHAADEQNPHDFSFLIYELQ